MDSIGMPVHDRISGSQIADRHFTRIFHGRHGKIHGEEVSIVAGFRKKFTPLAIQSCIQSRCGRHQHDRLQML
jgi:hypothetical protein